MIWTCSQCNAVFSHLLYPGLDTALHALNLRLEVNKITSSDLLFRNWIFIQRSFSLRDKNVLKNTRKSDRSLCTFLLKRCRKLIRKINISSPKKKESVMTFFCILKSGLFITLRRHRHGGVNLSESMCKAWNCSPALALRTSSIFPFSRFLQALSILHGRPASKSTGIFTRILKKNRIADSWSLIDNVRRLF